MAQNKKSAPKNGLNIIFTLYQKELDQKKWGGSLSKMTGDFTWISPAKRSAFGSSRIPHTEEVFADQLCSPPWCLEDKLSKKNTLRGKINQRKIKLIFEIIQF